MRNAFLVASTLSRFLLGGNLIGLGIFIIVWVYAIVAKEPWPTTERDLYDVVHSSTDIVVSLNNAKQLLMEAETASPEFFPRQPIADAIASLRGHLRQARRQRQATQHAEEAHEELRNGGRMIRVGVAGGGSSGGSGGAGSNAARRGPEPNANAIAARSGQPGNDQHTERAIALAEERKRERAMVLEWTLQDMTEDLALLHSTHTSNFTTLAGDAESKRYDRMQVGLSGLREAMHRKAADRVLMPAHKRALLQRLLVLRGLLGDQFVYALQRQRPMWQADERKLGLILGDDDTASHPRALPGILRTAGGPSPSDRGGIHSNDDDDAAASGDLNLTPIIAPASSSGVAGGGDPLPPIGSGVLLGDAKRSDDDQPATPMQLAADVSSSGSPRAGSGSRNVLVARRLGAAAGRPLIQAPSPAASHTLAASPSGMLRPMQEEPEDD